MKTYGKLVALMVAILVVGMGVYAEAATDQTVSVTLSASIVGNTSMSVAPSTMTFGNTGIDAFATTTSGKVTITYASNYNPWKIAIYTNNTQVLDYGVTNGRYAKGGLATGDGKYVVPLKWVAKAPASPAPLIGTIGGYNFVKDLRDQDDPATTRADQNESWASGLASGYPNIAFGTSASGVCVNPTNPPTYNGDTVTGSIAVYVAGLFGTSGMTPAVPASAGNYVSTLVFELYHE